jgi:signal transduction histidine kinase
VSRSKPDSGPMTAAASFDRFRLLSAEQSTIVRTLSLTTRRALHTLSGAVLTWVYLMLLWVALPVSVSLVIVWVGVPMLLATLAAVRGLAGAERRLAVMLLGVQIDAPPRLAELRASRGEQLRSLVTHSGTWRGLCYLAVRWVVGLVAFVVSITGAALTFAFAVLPFSDQFVDFDGFRPEPGLRSAWGPVVAVLIGAASWYGLAGIGWAHGWIARMLLGPSGRDRVAALEGRTATLSAQTKLARDLHDSVGHTMTSVVVQAGAARRLFEADPSFALEALNEIETSARQALDELDYMLGTLRNDGRGAERSPVPTLAELGQVLQTAERNGIRVSSALIGPHESVPGHVSRECFRIVQEGMTNVTKHAPNSHAHVRVEVGAASVTIEIVNPVMHPRVIGGSGAAGGRGLVGIHERAHVLRGVAWAGEVEGTHVLRVVIPFHASSRSAFDHLEQGNRGL